MSHFILPTLNAFLYCVIFMVVVVTCGMAYALLKYFCLNGDESNTQNHSRNYNIDDDEPDYNTNGFHPNRDDDPAPRYEHIPLAPVYKPASPRVSPVPLAPYPTGTVNPPYPTSSNGRSSPYATAPYPTNSSAPYPTENVGMPMPMPGAIAMPTPQMRFTAESVFKIQSAIKKIRSKWLEIQ
uniref:CSON003163 protein n=1 Tax=Culicoides sonorensis TaxID=179676 RepID=A0A336LSI8_CULSO